MNIYVGNLHEHASEKELKKLFSEYGSVLNVSIVMDDGGRTKSYALVEMEKDEDGMYAVKELHHQNYMNRYLEVSISPGKKKTGHRQRKRRK